MKKSIRNYLLSVLIGILALLSAVGMAACGDSGAKKHTLKFNAGDGIDIPDIVAAAGESITPPADPTKEGFEFDGWYLDADGTGEKQTLPTVMPEEDVTYYGKWTGLPKLTLSLGGGSLSDGSEFYLKAGTDLFAFVKDFAPVLEGHEFGKWTLEGVDLKEGDVMPEGGATLTAVWKVPFSVKLYKLDFASYDEYTAETGETKGFGYAGETVDLTPFVPEHYTLNTVKTGAVKLSEEGGDVLSVYVDPKYTRFTDVFEGTDLLYELETESGVLYLDRVGMEEGRKKSTSYNKETGAFSFETGEDDGDFVLSGMISGERFYYFRDTVFRTFSDYLGSAATLEIGSPTDVEFTPASGSPVSGGYSVNAETGRYVFTPTTGDPFEFVLIEEAGVLYFRLSDGIGGWYAYGGELTGGGWSILGFDGFGVATSLDDEGAEVEFDYIVRDAEKRVIDLPELGRIMLTDGTHEDLGGHKIDGTFSQSDGFEGDYLYQTTSSRRIDVLTLDGFGGAVRSYHTDEDPTVHPISDGTYKVEKDETWLIRSGGSIGNYGGVNQWLRYTAVHKEDDVTDPRFEKGNGSGTSVITTSTDEEGNTVNHFSPYYVSDDGTISFGNDYLSVLPGAYDVTNSFVYQGTDYPVDDTHKAFLYFNNHQFGDSSYQEVDLWYGTYSETRKDFIYELVVWAGWFADDNEIFDLDEGSYYNGMYFKDMTDDGTFEFDYEDWDGDPEIYKLFDDANGKLEIDARGVARFYPKSDDPEAKGGYGDPVVVSYKEVATGLISVLEFTFPASVPASVHTKYAIYSNYYDITADEESIVIIDLQGNDVKYLSIVYADGSTGGDVIIVMNGELSFVGLLYSDEESGVIALEFLLTGTIVPAGTSDDEFIFTNNDDVYYEYLDYYEDVDIILGTFSEFQFKVGEEDAFLYFDGYVLDLANGQDTLKTDGYGSATLTVGGTATRGSYYVEYNILTFTPETAADEEVARSYYRIDEEKKTFTPIDQNEDEGLVLGPYYGASVNENGLPESILLSTLFLDGVDTFTYEYLGEDLESIVTETGKYEVLSKNIAITGRLRGSFTIQLTFDKANATDADDVREAKLFLYDLYDDNGFYPLFAIQNDAQMGTYNAYAEDSEAADGKSPLGVLEGGDGYYRESASFTGTDRDGDFDYTGYMARGNIEDLYYDSMPMFSEDKNGSVVVFVTYIDGKMVQYVFDIDKTDPTKILYRDKFYGTVAEYRTQGGTTGNYLHLDGHSVAILYNENDEVVMSGTYETVPTMKDTYAFKANGKTEFLFTPSSTSYGGGVLYIYKVYAEEDEFVCVNDDWSILAMDGFGNGVYIDKYGVSYSGEYSTVIEDEGVYCLNVTGTTKRIYYQIHSDDNTFTLCQGEFLTSEDGGTLYVYFGTDESIRIPDGVHTIAGRAFVLSGASNIKHIDFNQVQTLEEYALNGMWALEEVVSDSIITVGPSAFIDTKTIVKVELPNCTEIGEKAFYNCNGIESVKLGKIQKIGAYAFSRDINWCPAWTLDLTEVEDLSKVEIDFTAFLALKGYFKIVNDTIMVDGSKILVSGGVDGLNAAATKLKGKTASISYHDLAGAADADNKTGELDVDLSPYVTLAAPSDDPASGLAFYSLASDTVLLFDGGLATVYEKDYYSYEMSKAYPYYIDDDGKAVLFSYDATEGYKQDLSVDLSATTLTLDGITYLKSGETATLTATVSGKTVTVTYKSEVTSSLFVSVSVTGVTYDGTPLDTDDYYFSYDMVLEFSAGGHYFTAELENGEFIFTDHGEEIVLEDKSQAIWFRITLLKSADDTYTLKTIEYNERGASSPDYYIDGTIYCTEKADEENTWSFTRNPNHYTLHLNASAQGDLTLTVINEGSVFTSNGFTITIKVKTDLTIEEIIEIKSDSETVDLQKLTYSEDKKSATFTLNDNTYIIKVSSYEYSPYFTVTAMQINYDLTGSGLAFDDDYNMFLIAAKVHIDEQGNLQIMEVTTFQDYFDDTDIEYSSATKNNDGSITLHLNDGKHAKISASMGSSGIDFSIEWVEA